MCSFAAPATQLLFIFTIILLWSSLFRRRALNLIQSSCHPISIEELFEYLSTYEIELDPHFDNLLGKHQRRPWHKFVNSENEHLVTTEALDLLSNLLK